MCCHPIIQHFDDTNTPDKVLSPWDFVPMQSRERGFLTIEDFFPINPIGSMSAVYRWSMVKTLPEWMKKYDIADLIMHLLHATKGKVGVLDDVMAVYRRHSQGIWFGNDKIEHQEKIAKKMSEMFIDLDYELNRNYKELFQPFKGPNIRILFLAAENSIHTYKWVKSLIEEERFEVQLFSTFRIYNAPDLFSTEDNVVVYKIGNQPSLREVVEIFKPDIIHSLHTQFSGFPVLDLKKTWERDFPVWILSTWGSDLFFWRNEPVQRKRLEKLLKHVDYLIGEGDRDYELAKDLGFLGQFLGCLPASAGMDLSAVEAIPRFPPSQRKEIMVKGYDLGVGRFRDALVALIRLKDRLAGYRINVYSPQMDKDMLTVYTQVSGLNICPLPQISNREMLEFFSRSRIAIACSYSDGLPGSLLEAMACGAFPIQTNSAITENWLEDGMSGNLVPPDDVPALVNAISRALEDDELVNTAALINLETIQTKANLSHQTKKIEKIYHQVTFEKAVRINKIRNENLLVEHGSTEDDYGGANRNKSLIQKFKLLLRGLVYWKMIDRSGFFDKKWYLRSYPDIKKTKMPATIHYILFGGFEGRNPSIYFDSRWYLSEYLDVKKSGMNPLVHFIKYGRHEGRLPKRN